MKLPMDLLKSITYYVNLVRATQTMESAITREKALKCWHRIWKIRIIEQMNPEWQDLYTEVV